MECVKCVIKSNSPCAEGNCRYYLEYPNDLNCTIIAIQKNGPMKLEQVGNRLHLTAARIKQIEQKTIEKLNKKSSLLKVLAE